MNRVLWTAAALVGLGAWAAVWLTDEKTAWPTFSDATGMEHAVPALPTEPLRASQPTALSIGSLQPASPQLILDLLPPGRNSQVWMHASATSAVIYWQTENRARSYVIYGETDRCTQRTPLAEVSEISGQPFWTHIHRLAGLRPDTEYHYRLICEGSDGSTATSDVSTFQTRTPAHAVRVPDDLPGPPYVLDRPQTRYLLTRNLTFPLGGLLIKADGVTLDMDGHELVYNDQPAERPIEWNRRAYDEHDFGIKVEGRVHVAIFNGVIRQGPGNSRGTPAGIGCNPLFSLAAANEIAGVELIWSGDDVSGAVLYDSQTNHVHHCVFDDRGHGISNRHMAVRAIGGNVWGDFDHNLVKATRQQGLANGVRVERNEIYLRSCATNSFGVTGCPQAGKPVEIGWNRIIGIGEHPVGIGMFGAFAPDSAVHHNRVEVRCTQRGAEFGYAGCACFRTTWGADQLDVSNNTFIAHAGRYGSEVAKARALWVGLPSFSPREGSEKLRDARGFFHHNRIIAVGPDGAIAGAICVVCLNESPHLIFLENEVTSTWGNVLLADSYGHADGYAKFVGNVFRREGRCADYFTVRQEYSGIPATGALLGNRCEDGAALTPMRLLAKGRVVILEPLDVAVENARGEPLGGARVEIVDVAGHEMFRDATPNAGVSAMLVSREGPVLTVELSSQPGQRGWIAPVDLSKGRLRAILPSTEVTSAGQSEPARYTLRASKPGFRAAVRPVILDHAQTIRVALADDGS